ncbi:alkene reductase [Amycolatopsis sp. NBC_00345]|uniref:alkene reductase n=1 Tax=Amycolatopsis sp. NBC_00345 TaxID=2975955 RepID=UPI002E27280E
MPTPFDPIQLGGLTLPNRIAMAPLTRRRAYGPGLSATPLMAEYYAQRSTAGLIVAEAKHPNVVGQGYTDMPGMHSDQQVRSWRPITDRVHAEGGRIFAQLCHGGRCGHPSLTGRHPVAPSAVAAEGQVRINDREHRPYPVPLELTVSQIQDTIADFASAAANAIAAGFDGVELHGGYGYLIQQFLVGNANLRTDRYGGSIAGRIRFALELVDAVAGRIGPHRVALRLSPGCTAFGLHEDDVDALYSALVGELRTDLAYFHLFEFPDHRALTAQLRSRWPGVLMLNPHATHDDSPAGPGQLHLIADGLADILAFGTAYVANPDLVHRLRVGAPLASADPNTFYRGDHRGYTDYPPLDPSHRSNQPHTPPIAI